MKKLFFVSIAASFVAFAAPSSASVESVTAGCAAGGNCLVLMQQEIAALKARGLQGAALNRAIADLVASVSQVANGTNNASISAAVSYAASESTDAGQSSAIQNIAQTLSDGGTVSDTETAALDDGDGDAGGAQGSGN